VVIGMFLARLARSAYRGAQRGLADVEVVHVEQKDCRFWRVDREARGSRMPTVLAQVSGYLAAGYRIGGS